VFLGIVQHNIRLVVVGLLNMANCKNKDNLVA
jgi:hypothetical protein